MGYIPVYEGEDVNGTTVRRAPGRIQATGVRSEPVALCEVVCPVRAPGTVQLDERRVAVVALRAEAFVERVEDVTTGDRVRVYPQLNTETRTARVRIESPNPDGALLPGMYAEVDIASAGGGPVVAVPNSAVIDSGTRQVAILDRGEGRFEPKEVKLGRRGGGFVEVREGVAEGDRVVASANVLIDAESNLRAALRGLAAAARQTYTAARRPMRRRRMARPDAVASGKKRRRPARDPERLRSRARGITPWGDARARPAP